MTIKSCFPSRFDDGWLLEVDFSQLEVVGLAILSGDVVLKNDILSGRDMHRMRAAELFHIPEHEVTSQQRQLSKQLSFQLQYGAGAKSMAEKNDIPYMLAKRFIFNYYDRYQRVKQWQEDVAAAVAASRKPTGEHTKAGYPKGVGEYQSATGRLYKFFEMDSDYRKEASFSPTEIKNYPVQGFATGDIMALYRGMVYRRWLAENLDPTAKLINTIHDSVMVDCLDMGVVEYVFRVMREEAEKLPGEIERLWGVKCDLPFKVEAKYGPTWADMNKLEV